MSKAIIRRRKIEINKHYDEWGTCYAELKKWMFIARITKGEIKIWYNRPFGSQETNLYSVDIIYRNKKTNQPC